MTRLCAAVLSSALLLALPACTPSGPSAGSSAPAETEHLAFYDSFETWNQEVPSNSVQVEEVERDGLLQYRFGMRPPVWSFLSCPDGGTRRANHMIPRRRPYTRAAPSPLKCLCCPCAAARRDTPAFCSRT